MDKGLSEGDAEMTEAQVWILMSCLITILAVFVGAASDRVRGRW